MPFSSTAVTFSSTLSSVKPSRRTRNEEKIFRIGDQNIHSAPTLASTSSPPRRRVVSGQSPQASHEVFASNCHFENKRAAEESGQEFGTASHMHL